MNWLEKLLHCHQWTYFFNCMDSYKQCKLCGKIKPVETADGY